MDYYPNDDAVIWFSCKVMPLIRKKVNARFCIVGAKPSRKVVALSKFPWIEVTGEVDDIRPYVWNSDICVFPLNVARGIQNKVLEAMSMAKPIVSSLQAFEGINAKNREDLLAVELNPDKFAKAVLALCEQPELAEKLGINAHKQATHYSWHTQLKQLDSLLS
jgi:glycosyltransferase involved in cell wall biosynthesis